MKRLLLILATMMLVAGANAAYNNTWEFEIGNGTYPVDGYQQTFTLSNTSGVHSNFVIYTNGTTLPTWVDVEFTDENGINLPFWIEEGTENATSVIVDVKFNTSNKIRVLYGNASATTSKSNCANTFDFCEDFNINEANYNSTRYYMTNKTAPMRVSGGYLNITTKGSTQNGGGLISAYNIASPTSPIVIRSRTNQVDHYTNGGIGGMIGTTENRTTTSQYNFRANFTGSIKARNSGWRIGLAESYSTDGDSWTATVNAGLIANNWTRDEMRIGRYPASSSNVINFTSIQPNGNLVYSGSLTTSSYKSNNKIYIGHTNYGTSSGYIFFVDWVTQGTGVSVTPTSGNWSTVGGSGTGTLNASFTHLPEPSSVGQAVALTDTSTGSPATWNWTIDGVLTNSTQNAAYIFSTAGSYPIFLNVTNATGAWSNTSATHTVVNASGYTPQDVWMEGQYNRTFHITSSSDGTPLAANYITSDGQTGTASTLGYAFITEGFGVYTITVSMTGYSTRTVSFIVDEDGTTEIQLTPYTDVTATRWTSTHDVVFYVRAITGEPVEDVNVTAVYIEESGGEGWLQSWAGVPSDVNVQNTTMHGTTGSDGAIDFLMVQSAKYHVTAYKSGVIDSYMDIYPKDDYYVFRQGFNSSVFYEHGADETKNIQFNISRTELNETYGRIRIEYTDLMDQTTQVVILVNNSTSTGNLTTEMTVVSYTSTAAGNFTYNFDMEGTRGNSYLVRCNSTGTVFPEVKRDYGVTFQSGPITLGIPEEFLVYAGMFVLIFIALCFTRTLPGPAVMVIMFFAWIFYMMRWWQDLGPDLVVGAALVFFTVAAVIFNVMIRSKKRIFE